MIDRSDPKHVYIFGNNFVGFHGFTYDKNTANLIKKTRKRFKCHKIKNDERCQNHLSINEEFIILYDNIVMTATEEEFYIESFDQYKIDSIRIIRDFIENIKCFRWSKEEKEYINFLINYLKDFSDYMSNDQYEDDEYDDRLIFDVEESMRWFIANVLDKGCGK
mgnify:CR=1 FL=1